MRFDHEGALPLDSEGVLFCREDKLKRLSNEGALFCFVHEGVLPSDNTRLLLTGVDTLAKYPIERAVLLLDRDRIGVLPSEVLLNGVEKHSSDGAVSLFIHEGVLPSDNAAVLLSGVDNLVIFTGKGKVLSYDCNGVLPPEENWVLLGGVSVTWSADEDFLDHKGLFLSDIGVLLSGFWMLSSFCNGNADFLGIGGGRLSSVRVGVLTHGN